VIVREFLALVGFEVDESSLSEADHALELVKKGYHLIEGAVRLAARALDEVVFSTARAAAELEHVAQQTGIGTTELQRLQYAAEQSGVGADEMRTSLIHLARSAVEASQGSEEAGKAFAQLGVRTTDGRGKVKPMSELLGDVADKFKAMPEGAARAQLATQLFSRSGAQLIPFLARGREGIAALGDEAERLGAVLSEGAVAQGVELTHGVDRLGAALTGLKYAIAGPLLDQVLQLVDAMTAWVAANREWLAAEVVETVQDLASGFMSVFRALRNLYQLARPWLVVLKGILTNTTLLKGVLVLVSAVLLSQFGAAVASSIASIGALITSLQAATAAEFAWGGGAIWAGTASAASAVAAGGAWALLALFIAGLVEDLYGFSEGSDSLAGTWVEFLDEVLKPQPGEPWFTRWILTAISAIFDLQGAWLKFYAAIGPTLKNVMIVTTAMSTGGLSLLTDKAVSNEGDSLLDQLGPTAVYNRLFGEGASSPTASAANSSNFSSSAQSYTSADQYEITVNPPAGVDAAEVARLTREQIQASHDEEMRVAHSRVSR
jgi:hypothetical protein